MLQPPGQSDGAEHRAESRHGQEPRKIAAHHPRLALHPLAGREADGRRARIQQCGGGEGTQSLAEMLDQRRADAKENGGKQCEQAAFYGGQGKMPSSHGRLLNFM